MKIRATEPGDSMRTECTGEAHGRLPPPPANLSTRLKNNQISEFRTQRSEQMSSFGNMASSDINVEVPF